MSDELPLILMFGEVLEDPSPEEGCPATTRKTGVGRETTDDD